MKGILNARKQTQAVKQENASGPAEMSFVTLEDATGIFEVVLFPEQHERYGAKQPRNDVIHRMHPHRGQPVAEGQCRWHAGMGRWLAGASQRGPESAARRGTDHLATPTSA